ncbi:hypothetical protein LCGC14_0643000 [marine sediment metagenome]|uniref:Sulfotransferase domain-containing protein n=1 Tax=marine sediment metagenome TaxID=412755 RepID=A0A0F9QYP5_9ZZZZ|nr:hypothetical protein [Candidatus Aminicenantes bacterium]
MQLVIGFGTGRCGTGSFAALLGGHPGAVGYHEYDVLPWEFDLLKYYSITQRLTKMGFDMVVDAGFYWLNYLERLIEDYPDVKAVCLQKDAGTIVDSYMDRSLGDKGYNFWTKKDSSHWNSNKCFVGSWPQYDLPKREALGQYWKEYTDKAWTLEKTYPDNVLICSTGYVLNMERFQVKMLDFIGIPREEQRLNVGIRSDNKVTKGESHGLEYRGRTGG